MNLENNNFKINIKKYMKLIPRYLSGRSIIMNKSSIPGTSPLTSSTINYNWELRATNNESVKKAEQERAQQAYLDRRGYISEDKDKRSYTERDHDAKIAATQNAKTDFYLMGTPNSQSTDVTPGQVLLPTFIAGTTFINPVASLVYGGTYKPMEKAGVYQPVSLGLQKLGVNENTANLISPFITDPAVSLLPSGINRFVNAYNKAWNLTYGNLNNLGIKSHSPRSPKSPSSSAPISAAALNFLDNGIRMLLNDLALGNTNTSFPFFKEGRDYTIRPLLQKTLDVIDEQVAPRLFKLREYIMSTPLNDRYFRGVIDQVKKRTKVSEWSPEMMDEYNRLNNESAGGWSLPDKPYIVVGRNSIRPTALTEIHEARHQIQNQINKHPNEIKVLRKAYEDVPRPYNSDGSIRPGYEDYDMTPEWETMNTEARSVLLDLAGYKYNPDLSPEQNVEIQNRIIESYENGQMARTLHDDVGGYWTYYIDLFRDSNIPTETRREKIALWKKAMQLIGMGTGITYGINLNKK